MVKDLVENEAFKAEIIWTPVVKTGNIVSNMRRIFLQGFQRTLTILRGSHHNP